MCRKNRTISAARVPVAWALWASPIVSVPWWQPTKTHDAHHSPLHNSTQWGKIRCNLQPKTNCWRPLFSQFSKCCTSLLVLWIEFHLKYSHCLLPDPIIWPKNCEDSWPPLSKLDIVWICLNYVYVHIYTFILQHDVPLYMDSWIRHDLALSYSIRYGTYGHKCEFCGCIFWAQKLMFISFELSPPFAKLCPFKSSHLLVEVFLGIHPSLSTCWGKFLGLLEGTGPLKQRVRLNCQKAERRNSSSKHPIFQVQTGCSFQGVKKTLRIQTLP